MQPTISKITVDSTTEHLQEMSPGGIWWSRD